jgi:Zn-dependent peptidase ImmA (M78 family)
VDPATLVEKNKMPNIDEAKAEAREVLRESGITEAPVNPITVAKRLGYSVNAAIFDSRQTSGTASKRNGHVRIDVNATEHPNRRRFTIAHEIGHARLHLNGVNNASITDTEYRTSTASLRPTKEVEADTFAAELLMPEAWVAERFKIDQDLSSLARYFGVSNEAMKIQLEKLGLRYTN